MTTRTQILKEIETFLKETGIAPTTFGLEATGDRALMITLRKGRDLKTATVDKIRAYMAKERAKLKSRPNRRPHGAVYA